ncbi:UNVERIFIED_CONTAM: hypothetical protein K2H54_038534 [Gekko kuhli]
MYLVDSPPERGVPSRKTVYRISVTLVKREALGLAPEEGEGAAAASLDAPGQAVRSWRALSAGQLELGRLKAWKRPALGCRGPAGEAAAAGGEGAPRPARQPPPLRRCCSFRHGSGGGEVLRARALARSKRHASSGCLALPPAAQEHRLLRPPRGRCPSLGAETVAESPSRVNIVKGSAVAAAPLNLKTAFPLWDENCGVVGAF